MFNSFHACAIGAAVMLSLAGPASAHHPDLAAGGAGGGVVTVPAATLEEGHFGLSIFTQFVGFGSVNFDALTPGTDTHQMRSLISPSLAVAYGITNDFTLAARLPWIRRTDIVDGHIHSGGHHPHIEDLGNSSGIGDLTLLGQYRFLNRPDWGLELAALVGVKIPTGKTKARSDSGDRFEAEFQPGSGSWDGLFGAAASKSFGGWSLHANVLYVLATTGTQHTDLGDRLYYNLAVAWRAWGGPNENGVVSGAFAVDAILELNGEWQARERIAGERDPNSGGNVVYLSPGLRAVYRGTSAAISVGLPILRDLNGLQSKPGWRLLTGISTTF